MDSHVITVEDDNGEDHGKRSKADWSERRKGKRKRNSYDYPAMYTAPSHVHNNEWRDMINLVDILGPGKALHRAISWIPANLKKRECTAFIPSHKYINKCGCGLSLNEHNDSLLSGAYEKGEAVFKSAVGGERLRQRWTIRKHTVEAPTDSYGIIDFDGGGHQSSASYARVAFDTSPDLLLRLLQNVWHVRPPKVIITIHGGLVNFDLQPKLARTLHRGIMKAAQSTDAWIITNGLHQGALRHISAALEDLRLSRKTKGSVTTIGIAPWGLLKKRTRLVGENSSVKYNMNAFSNGRLVELDDAHSFFLLADNGTFGRYGAEIVLRRRFETLLATGTAFMNPLTAPLVCLVVEGGVFTVKVIHDYLTTPPFIPVVICDGSGRASDLISFAQHCLQHQDRMSESVRAHLLVLVKRTFNMDEEHSLRVLRSILDCAQSKKLLTVFRLGDDTMGEFDEAIFSALLKGQNVSPLEQLRLALAWDRADIAQKEIFRRSTSWPSTTLQEALMEALVFDRVDFVRLLLEYGVPMQNFLTFERLEQLYNTVSPVCSHFSAKMLILFVYRIHNEDKSLYNPLRRILRNSGNVNLLQIGQIIDRLMGYGYQSQFSSADFIAKYNTFLNRHQYSNGSNKISSTQPAVSSEASSGSSRKKSRIRISSIFSTRGSRGNTDNEAEEVDEEDVPSISSTQFTFSHPFHDLLIWAVLTRRHEMAKCMWRHGQEPLAKALVASRLYFSLSSHAPEGILELQLLEELVANAEEFRDLSTELLATCHTVDDELTKSLLTYELKNWGGQTCLTLANLIENLSFMGHPWPVLL